MFAVGVPKLEREGGNERILGACCEPGIMQAFVHGLTLMTP